MSGFPTEHTAKQARSSYMGGGGTGWLNGRRSRQSSSLGMAAGDTGSVKQRIVLITAVRVDAGAGGGTETGDDQRIKHGAGAGAGQSAARSILPTTIAHLTPRLQLTTGNGVRRDGLLADQQDIDGAQVEVVKERESRKAVVGRMLAGVELLDARSADGQAPLLGHGRPTMTVLPLYWMIWHERPTSLPPPRQRNMSSSDGSTGSSGGAAAMAEALRLDAITGYSGGRELRDGSSSQMAVGSCSYGWVILPINHS